MLRLAKISKIIQDEFSDILKEAPLLFHDHIRLTFIDNSYMEIRYPLDNKYSFHWQKEDSIFRIDTAPHHKNIKSYPRHIHDRTENNLIEDEITNFKNTPEENVRNVLIFVKGKIKAD